MLMAMVSFDENCQMWTNDENYNRQYLLSVESYINDIVRYRGYIYLNEIYDKLGVEWNSDDENQYVKRDSVDRLAFVQFELFKMDRCSYVVNIMRYD